jgi:hypothetical protein
MIAIAVVASLVAYAWVMGFLGGKTTQAGNAIQIQSYTTNGNLVLYVQNTGDNTVHLKADSSVYVNDTLYNIIESPAGTTAPDSIPITVGQTVEIVTDFTYNPATDTIRIKIVTTEGTFMQTTGNSGSSSSGNNNGNGGSGGTTYHVTFTLGAGGASMTPTGTQSYSSGASVPLTAVAASGYQFAGWTSTGTITFDSTASASTNAHIGSDGTITATFAEIQTGQNYQVQFVLGAGGASITPSAGTHTYAAGSSVAITATASSGYQFAGWSSTGSITFDSASTASTNAHINSDGTVTATFTSTGNPQSDQLVFTQGTGQSLLTGEPSAQIRVQRQTSSGSAITTGVTSVSLTATAGTFYSDQYCSSAITSIPINSGTSDATVYYKAATSGSPMLTASATNYASASTTFTISSPEETTEMPATTDFDGPRWDEGWNYWTNPPWNVYSGVYHSAPDCVRSVQSNQGAFSSSPQDATGAEYVVVTFQFRINQYVQPSNFQLRYGVTVTSNYNSVNWINLGVNLGDTSVYSANEWHQYTVVIPNDPAFTTHFRFQFLSQGMSSAAAIYIDDVTMTMVK